MSEPTAEQIKDATCELTHELQSLFAGKPTAAVYMAIGYSLGEMEALTPRPDRQGLFRILGHAMDDMIRLCGLSASRS